MKIARVFPRKTNLTPCDSLSFIGDPDLYNMPNVGEVHISVTFSTDMPEAEKLYNVWSKYYGNVKMGGVALQDPGSEFVPGMYIKEGNVITSRGCPNKCWFCDVWKREGNTRELIIQDGYNLLDSNILACSDAHIKNVFLMLFNQKEEGHKITFTGGFEAARLKPWHVDLLWHLGPTRMYFAYDTKDDLEPLIYAGEMLRYANFTRSHLYCYVLIGYKKDTPEKANKRLIEAWVAGFLPFAMLWKPKDPDKEHRSDYEMAVWEDFQRNWVRPPLVKRELKGTTQDFFKQTR